MFTTILLILGSLGLFFYGMKIMSEGVLKVAGYRFRSMIANVTQTRFHGLLAGLSITALIQSSSAVTVMVVSFVHARLLNLRQAMGIIMGSNLGTTITAWIVAFIGTSYLFDFRDFAVIAVACGTALLLVRNAYLRNIASIFIGFGILFIGLALLRDYVLNENLNLEGFIRFLQENDYNSTVVFFLVGLFLSVAVQSSSVAVTITMMLAFNGKIDMLSATAIILGENLGTTTTALIASFGCSRNAKRAALLHVLFNGIGVLWMLPLLVPYTQLLESLNIGFLQNPDITGSKMDVTVGVRIALFHTTFNLFNICLLIGFVPYMVKLVEFIIPRNQKEKEQERNDTPELVHANSSAIFSTGEINIYQAERQLKRLVDISEKMFSGFLQVYKNPEQSIPTLLMEIEKYEQQCDHISKDLVSYLINCSAGAISLESEGRIATLINATAEIEEVCDGINRLVQLAEKRYRKKRILPEIISEEFLRNIRPLRDNFEFLGNLTLRKVTPADVAESSEQRDFFKRLVKRLIKDASMRMHQGNKNMDGELLHIQMLNECNAISRHLNHITKSLIVRKTNR